MAASTPIVIPEKSQQALLQFHRQCYSMLNSQWDIREQLRRRDLAYMRENDWTQEAWRARIANKYGDPTKFQNLTLPIVMPQVESAVTYQASVFLTGNPIFGWVAPSSQEDSAIQMQAIVEENSIRGGWTQQLMVFFRDCFKYNLGLVETGWDRIVTAAIETDVSFGKEGKPKEVIWEGNTVRRWDPYNSFWDCRYKPTEIYKDGEFVGQTQLMSRIHLKKFINELPDKMISNIKAAFESGLGEGAFGAVGGLETYYMPLLNPDALMQQDPRRTTDWMSWAGLLDRPPGEIAYRNLYEVTTLYARIIPQDFRLRVPSANTPQVWKFIIVNHQVLIYAERQTNAHNYLPVLFGQPNEDGLSYQTKSFSDNVEPFQAVGSALVNSAMAARRRAISDRGIYNPSMISAAHVNSDSPTAKIPLRPAAYGKPINEAYYAIPFRDENSQFAFQEVSQVQRMAEYTNQQNPAKQGQFVKGNKTLHEYQDVQAHANGRDQTTAMVLEGQVFTPMKEIIKLNTMQFQSGVSIFSPSQQELVKIDPVALRKSAVTYRISDGLTPTDKLISGDELATAVQVIGSSQQIGQGYNLAPMFSYMMKTRNLDLGDFEKSQGQIQYEQAVAQWQQACAQIAEIIKAVSIKIENVTLQDVQKLIQQMLPPQPKPQDYGYNPNQQGNPPQQQATPQQLAQSAVPQQLAGSANGAANPQ